MVLKIKCLRCHTLLTSARRGDDGRVSLTNRCRWEQVTPPDAPEERWKWWCPNPRCRRPREIRSARVGATLDEMTRRGLDVADI